MTHLPAAPGLDVAAPLRALLTERVLPPLGLDPAAWFEGVAALIRRLAPENAALLAHRDDLQRQLDAWWRANPDPDIAAHEAFLRQIGYLHPAPAPFTIGTENVDPEVARIAGPQLVVPLDNARYALNAVAARWGDLYDALYGTDVLGSPPPSGPYDAARGAQVVARAKAFLDEAAPLIGASHAAVTRYRLDHHGFVAEVGDHPYRLAEAAHAVAFAGTREAPTAILLTHHGLGIELVLDRAHPVGATDPAGLATIRVEAALTTIMDCEDSVAAVDAADKAHLYANWLGLMRGDLTATFTKTGRAETRAFPADDAYTGLDGHPHRIRRRSLLFIRNVGHLMLTDAMLLDGQPIPEGMLDTIVTSTIALHDRARLEAERNSPAGGIYIVKPKMHGPAEIAFAEKLFAGTEDLLNLPRNTLKIGVMDEERRTSLNLAACIAAVKDRIVFINTGFLDRTGDEMHSAMAAGPMLRKEAMRATPWFKAYEDNNVDTGLAAGFPGRAQIGKGMWAAPDRMADMLATKHAHPMAGANAAWVPSPTAATLHAMHYHGVDVAARQRAIAAAGPRARLADLLTAPVARATNWPDDELQAELDNNAQGILGYVVRWIDQGVGCSKVPDIHDVGLMEDRATLRISSQHIANWLAHGIITPARVEETLKRMAAVVDRQNAGDPAYTPMAPACDGPAFAAARALIFQGAAQPNGYTEPLLHVWRLRAKG